MKFSSVWLSGVAAISLSVVFPSALAEDLEQKTLDIVKVEGQYLYSDQVNALKAPTPIIDVPQSLSIVSADDISIRGYTSIGQIIDYTPGVNNSQGEGHRDSVVFRGVRSTADFFIDGVRDDVQYYRPLYNLEQVEILRGPNALLFGRGGTGGILNRVTKKAQLDETFVGYQASLDSEGEYGLQFDANYGDNDKAAFRLNAMFESLDNHRDFYDGERIGINPTAEFVITPGTILDVSYEYVDHERFVDRGIPTGEDGRPVEAFADIVFGDPELNTTQLEAHILRVNLEQEFTESLKGNVTLLYGDYDKLYENFYAADYSASNADFGGAETVTLDGYVDTTQRRNLVLSGNLVGEFDTGPINHTLIVGAEFIDTSNDNDRLNPVFATSGGDRETFLVQRPLAFVGGVGTIADGITSTSLAFTDVNDDNQSDVEVMSIFAQDQIEINKYVDVVLGARFDRFDQSTFNVETGVTTDRTDEEVSPRAGLIVKPMENISLYASYSETFLPTSGEQFASTGSLAPDVFEQAEIGVKWDFFDGISFTAAYFQNDQTQAARDQDTEEDFEVRGLEIQGFELQLLGNVTEKLFVSAGYSHLTGETENGAELPRELPENTFSIWGNYQVTDKFGLGLGATYQDEAFITDLDIGSDASTHPTLPSFTRFDASAYYDISEKLRVQLNVENLTEEVYFPTSHSTHQVTVGAPLNARVAISGRF